jgi:Amt family ammonium transporter
MKRTHLFSALAAAALMALSPFGTILRAQDAAPAAAPAEEPAKPADAAPAAAADAKPADATLEQRVFDLETYFNNVAPGVDGDKKWATKIGVAGPGHNCVHDGLRRAGAVHDAAWPGPLLWRPRAEEECALRARTVHGHRGLVTILWYICGYSLVFGEASPEDGGGAFFGSLKYMFLKGVTGAPNTNYTAWPSQNVFAMYQLMFAIITPALIIGAIAERMKFIAVLLFVAIWMFVVYFPLAHMVWGFDGLMNGVWNGDAKIPAIDFAGGTVVHMSSGWSALVLCMILGKRLGFGKEKMAPHSMVLVWSAPACSGSAGTASMPDRPSPPTVSPPTPSPPPRSPPRRPASSGPWSNGFTKAIRPSSVSARASWPASWSSLRRAVS